jgi:hypothetical protein
MVKSDTSDSWISATRRRLAARSMEKPATKAGQIRALWPEIHPALDRGQSMKSIRIWLEEAGISVAITSLTSYISRIRPETRKGMASGVSLRLGGWRIRSPAGLASTQFHEHWARTETEWRPARPGDAGVVETEA